ncbi:hypothetical protein E5Q_03636 [Mixia osmundae IAM 14324]|uniref:Uncharacterized protein n=1 Tax=Mixia osmundae (strain CBS 9802 / IAM 14324 / JCM 22182 / KY 12970) TaxID=764103 RepID=G7E2A2_MIXOS|nr:hypothetical protein E5Q_03636 [Mixia osmundae IAM 14324]
MAELLLYMGEPQGDEGGLSVVRFGQPVNVSRIVLQPTTSNRSAAYPIGTIIVCFHLLASSESGRYIKLRPVQHTTAELKYDLRSGPQAFPTMLPLTSWGLLLLLHGDTRGLEILVYGRKREISPVMPAPSSGSRASSRADSQSRSPELEDRPRQKPVELLYDVESALTIVKRLERQLMAEVHQIQMSASQADPSTSSSVPSASSSQPGPFDSQLCGGGPQPYHNAAKSSNFMRKPSPELQTSARSSYREPAAREPPSAVTTRSRTPSDGAPSPLPQCTSPSRADSSAAPPPLPQARASYERRKSASMQVDGPASSASPTSDPRRPRPRPKAASTETDICPPPVSPQTDAKIPVSGLSQHWHASRSPTRMSSDTSATPQSILSTPLGSLGTPQDSQATSCDHLPTPRENQTTPALRQPTPQLHQTTPQLHQPTPLPTFATPQISLPAPSSGRAIPIAGSNVLIPSRATSTAGSRTPRAGIPFDGYRTPLGAKCTPGSTRLDIRTPNMVPSASYRIRPDEPEQPPRVKSAIEIFLEDNPTDAHPRDPRVKLQLAKKQQLQTAYEQWDEGDMGTQSSDQLRHFVHDLNLLVAESKQLMSSDSFVYELVERVIRQHSGGIREILMTPLLENLLRTTQSYMLRRRSTKTDHDTVEDVPKAEIALRCFKVFAAGSCDHALLLRITELEPWSQLDGIYKKLIADSAATIDDSAESVELREAMEDLGEMLKPYYLVNRCRRSLDEAAQTKSRDHDPLPTVRVILEGASPSHAVASAVAYVLNQGTCLEGMLVADSTEAVSYTTLDICSHLARTTPGWACLMHAASIDTLPARPTVVTPNAKVLKSLRSLCLTRSVPSRTSEDDIAMTDLVQALHLLYYQVALLHNYVQSILDSSADDRINTAPSTAMELSSRASMLAEPAIYPALLSHRRVLLVTTHNHAKLKPKVNGKLRAFWSEQTADPDIFATLWWSWQGTSLHRTVTQLLKLSIPPPTRENTESHFEEPSVACSLLACINRAISLQAAVSPKALEQRRSFVVCMIKFIQQIGTHLKNICADMATLLMQHNVLFGCSRFELWADLVGRCAEYIAEIREDVYVPETLLAVVNATAAELEYAANGARSCARVMTATRARVRLLLSQLGERTRDPEPLVRALLDADALRPITAVSSLLSILPNASKLDSRKCTQWQHALQQDTEELAITLCAAGSLTQTGRRLVQSTLLAACTFSVSLVDIFKAIIESLFASGTTEPTFTAKTSLFTTLIGESNIKVALDALCEQRAEFKGYLDIILDAERRGVPQVPGKRTTDLAPIADCDSACQDYSCAQCMRTLKPRLEISTVVVHRTVRAALPASMADALLWQGVPTPDAEGMSCVRFEVPVNVSRIDLFADDPSSKTAPGTLTILLHVLPQAASGQQIVARPAYFEYVSIPYDLTAGAQMFPTGVPPTSFGILLVLHGTCVNLSMAVYGNKRPPTSSNASKAAFDALKHSTNLVPLGQADASARRYDMRNAMELLDKCHVRVNVELDGIERQIMGGQKGRDTVAADSSTTRHITAALASRTTINADQAVADLTSTSAANGRARSLRSDANTRDKSDIAANANHTHSHHSLAPPSAADSGGEASSTKKQGCTDAIRGLNDESIISFLQDLTYALPIKGEMTESVLLALEDAYEYWSERMYAEMSPQKLRSFVEDLSLVASRSKRLASEHRFVYDLAHQLARFHVDGVRVMLTTHLLDDLIAQAALAKERIVVAIKLHDLLAACSSDHAALLRMTEPHNAELLERIEARMPASPTPLGHPLRHARLLITCRARLRRLVDQTAGDQTVLALRRILGQARASPHVASAVACLAYDLPVVDRLLMQVPEQPSHNCALLDVCRLLLETASGLACLFRASGGIHDKQTGAQPSSIDVATLIKLQGRLPASKRIARDLLSIDAVISASRMLFGQSKVLMQYVERVGAQHPTDSRSMPLGAMALRRDPCFILPALCVHRPVAAVADMSGDHYKSEHNEAFRYFWTSRFRKPDVYARLWRLWHDTPLGTRLLRMIPTALAQDCRGKPFTISRAAHVCLTNIEILRLPMPADTASCATTLSSLLAYLNDLNDAELTREPCGDLEQNGALMEAQIVVEEMMRVLRDIASALYDLEDIKFEQTSMVEKIQSCVQIEICADLVGRCAEYLCWAGKPTQNVPIASAICAVATQLDVLYREDHSDALTITSTFMRIRAMLACFGKRVQEPAKIVRTVVQSCENHPVCSLTLLLSLLPDLTTAGTLDPKRSASWAAALDSALPKLVGTLCAAGGSVDIGAQLILQFFHISHALSKDLPVGIIEAMLENLCGFANDEDTFPIPKNVANLVELFQSDGMLHEAFEAACERQKAFKGRLIRFLKIDNDHSSAWRQRRSMLIDSLQDASSSAHRKRARGQSDNFERVTRPHLAFSQTPQRVSSGEESKEPDVTTGGKSYPASSFREQSANAPPSRPASQHVDVYQRSNVRS